MRPTLFYPIWTYYLAGFYGGLHSSGPAGIFPKPWGWLQVFLALAAVMGAVFVLNQTQDVVECVD